MLTLFHDLSGCFAADLTDLTLQSPDTSFFCIEVDDLAKCTCLNGKSAPGYAIDLQLLRNQMFFGNVLFLILSIPGNLNDFHTVKKRPGDFLHVIGCCNKQNFRKILWYFDIMVIKMTVLLRVQYFQKC